MTLEDKKSARPSQKDRPSATRTQDSPPSLQGNHGSFSDEAQGLVQPGRANDGDAGVATDKPEAGGQLNFDDGDMVDGGRGNNVRTGGTWQAEGADSAPLGAPAEIFSETNQPSDQQDLTDGAASDGNTT